MNTVELHPTKTRLALLHAVEQGHVRYYPGSMGYPDRDYWDEDEQGYRGRKVTARVSELYRAGWIARDSRRLGHWQPIPYRLTAAGRAVLEQHGGAS